MAGIWVLNWPTKITSFKVQMYYYNKQTHGSIKPCSNCQSQMPSPHTKFQSQSYGPWSQRNLKCVVLVHNSVFQYFFKDPSPTYQLYSLTQFQSLFLCPRSEYVRREMVIKQMTFKTSLLLLSQLILEKVASHRQ